MGRLLFSATLLSLIFNFSLFPEVDSTTFKIVNKCRRTIWPGILTGADRPLLNPTGFVLQSGKSRTLRVPRSWSGRLWARTHCSTDPSTGKFSCATADCGSGKLECAGSGAIPPATLAEFTLNGDQGLDFYDVSLVDGYNLPMLIIPKGGTRGGPGGCSSTGCLVDLNGACPRELAVARGNGSRESVACKSACEAFGDPVYCCSEAYNTPNTCSPSVYSLFFKHACPRSYSYAYDDKTSTFTCASADYIIIFCPLPYTRMTQDSLPSCFISGRNRTVAFGATFTFVNKCEYTVWPGILANAGSPTLDSTGFELPPDSSRTFIAPAGWSGRFWGRTGCTFSGSEPGSCQTGDCGSGQAECNGSGAAPPATLAEFTLGTGGLDFYDVSLVDGYNLPMIVETTGGSGMCASTGCVTDLNRVCPSELRVGGGEACKSACEAFGSPEYCCSGTFNSPATCRPSVYSQMFKSACPRSYSYAYDDPTSTFTCSGADYTVTFCPSMPRLPCVFLVLMVGFCGLLWLFSLHHWNKVLRIVEFKIEKIENGLTDATAIAMNDPLFILRCSCSQKSSKDPNPTMTAPGATNADGSLSGSDTGTGGSASASGLGFTGSDPDSASGTGSHAMLSDGSWLAGLAMGDSTRVYCSWTLQFAVFIASAIFIVSGFS
ncbi:UNVERIFIED_CONTAM: Thaumatin-like protein 1 [Sesamum calycinum]|uniref:Thaumatin-like protein 1 n=1 Tax=Sesamum calycinum TaxID=2727403 RepID=A0AAW2PN97_9LAMI